MDFTHGILGLAGFLLVELSWLISKRKAPSFEGKPVSSEFRYYGTILLFGLITVIIVAIIGPSDLSMKIWPPVFSNPTLAESGRSVGLGVACLLIYKSPSKLASRTDEGGGPRLETTTVSLPKNKSFLDFVREWSRGF